MSTLEHSMLLLELQAMMPSAMAEYAADLIDNQTAYRSAGLGILYTIAVFREPQCTTVYSGAWLPVGKANGLIRERQIAVLHGNDLFRATTGQEHAVLWTSKNGLNHIHIPTEWWRNVDEQVS